MDGIKVNELQKLIHLNDSEIPRLKGLKQRGHNKKIEKCLLSPESGFLNFDDLKLYTIYIFVKKDIYTIPKRIEQVFNLVKINNNSLDDTYKKLVIENKNKIYIDEEELFENFTVQTCIKVLKQLCPLRNKEKFYPIEDLLNIKNKNRLSINNNLINEDELKNYDYKNILDYIYDNYSQNKDGFFALQHPTGNGKTFFLEKFLLKNILEDFTNLKHKKIIVLTSSKVNVNEIYRNIEKELKKKKEEKKINYIFQMKSIMDILYNVDFLKEILRELEKDLYFYEKLPINFIIKFKDEIKNLIRYIEQNALRSNDFDIITAEYLPIIKKHMFRYFRLQLKKEKTEDELNELEKIVLPNFLKKLYPMICQENIDKKIFIMTTDKFLYGYVGRTETNFFYQENENLIFIDEIDSCKNNFLKYIENTKILTINNIINTFNERYNSFTEKTNNSIANLMQRLKKLEDDKVIKLKKSNNLYDKKLINTIKNMRKKILIKLRKYRKKGKELRNYYMTTQKYYEMFKKERIFLFEDENHYFTSFLERYYIDLNDKNALITDKKTSLPLDVMLKRLFYYSYVAFSYFLLDIYKYHQLIKQDNELEKEIISHFIYNLDVQKQVTEQFKNFFIERSLTNFSRKEKELLKELKKENFNLKNCCFQIEEENPSYQLNNKVLISSYMMYLTPEILLYSIASKNMVFGISATAMQESCIGNFNLKWLRSKLLDRYYFLSFEEQNKLKDSLSQINSFENNIERKLNVFGNDQNIKLGFDNIVILEEDKRFANKIRNILNTIFKDKNYKDENYKTDEREIQKRYFEYSSKVFLNFLLEKKSSSLLFISNRLTQVNMLENVVKVLEKFLKQQKLLDKKVYFKDLNAKSLNQFLEAKEEVTNELMNNLKDPNIKTIIFTTYQSAGTGVNIKFSRENFDKNQLVELDENLQKEIKISLDFKDIDEIAIENKTHLIKFDEDRKKFLVEMMYYSNLMVDNNIISKIVRSYLLKKSDPKIFISAYKSSYDYVENAMSKIIQAMGRVNRTKVRNRFKNIYFDYDTFKIFEKFEPRDRLFNEDINFCIREIKNNMEMEEPSKIVKNIICENNKVRNSFKIKFLNEIAEYNKFIKYSNDNEEKEKKIKEFISLIERYDEYRKYIVLNPTRSKKSVKNSSYFSIGKKIKNYHIIRENKSSEIIKDIIFNLSQNNVSFEECKLKEIFEIPLLKEFCKKNIGTFKEDEEIILPYIYQAIFKGYIGEIIIKEIFRLYDIRLKDKEFLIRKGIFEVFDDVSINGMWIDYKNYNLDNFESRLEFNKCIVEKTTEKSSLITIKNKLFFINLISSSIANLSQKISFYKIKDIVEEIKLTCSYDESEIVIVSGILKYSEDKKSLDLDTSVIKELQRLLEVENEK